MTPIFTFDSQRILFYSFFESFCGTEHACATFDARVVKFRPACSMSYVIRWDILYTLTGASAPIILVSRVESESVRRIVASSTLRTVGRSLIGDRESVVWVTYFRSKIPCELRGYVEGYGFHTYLCRPECMDA